MNQFKRRRPLQKHKMIPNPIYECNSKVLRIILYYTYIHHYAYKLLKIIPHILIYNMVLYKANDNPNTLEM